MRTDLKTGLLAAAGILVCGAALAQKPGTQPTADRHADLAGVWVADFVTPLERPEGVASLIVPAEKAAEVVGKAAEKPTGVYDPDADYFFPDKLLKVRGEQRSSMIVEPPDGQLPLTALGKAIRASREDAWQTNFDGPEDRPAGERCLASLGHPPLHAISIVIPVEILITPAAVVITTEDTDSARIVDMTNRAPPSVVRTRAGYSSGRWEGDTLVVETTHIAADDPSGAVFRDTIMLTEGSRIVERFSLTSDRDLLYQFTVVDPALYNRPWLGEYVMTRRQDRLYEYACHEGNRGMENILLAAKLGRQKPQKMPDK